MNDDAIQPAIACIGLGSNLDDPIAQIHEAVTRLDESPCCKVLAVSSLFRSAPLGPTEQPDFVNAAATIEVDLGGHELLEQLQRIEADMGRPTGGQRWGPRVIDLDLLVMGDLEINDNDLVVPHPGISVRNFVLLPLREIAPDLIIPGLGPLADIAVDERSPRIERIA